MTWLDTFSNFINSKRALFGAGFVLLGLYFLPYFLYGESSYVSIYDNLDSTVVWLKVLAHSGMIFADSMAIIPNMMSGIPRLSYGSEFNVILWLYYFFDAFTAYVINDIVIHSIAFVGMFTLLSNYFIDEKTPNRYFIVFTVSILFAMIPFWPSGGLSVAGQPLVLWAFLNIRANRSSYVEWLVLGLVPFYSSLVLAMFFVLIMITAIFIYDTVTTRKINYKFLSALAFMSLVFLFVEYRLVDVMLFGTDYISHRIDFVRPTKPLEEAFLGETLRHFLGGYKNANSLQTLYIVPFVLFVVFGALLPRGKTKLYTLIAISLFMLTYVVDFWQMVFGFRYIMLLLPLLILVIYIFKKEYKQLYLLLLLQFLLTFYIEAWYYDGITVVTDIFPFAAKFNFSRMIYVQPIIWYLVLGSALVVVAKRYLLSGLVIGLLLLVQLTVALDSRYFVKADSDKLSFKTYYAIEQFEEMKKGMDENLSSFRVASIGMDPVIAVFNGLYTIDGYSANYPHAYKEKFRQLYPEWITKDPQFVALFDKWGSKCYIYDRDVTYVGYPRGRVLSHLSLNRQVLHELNVRYLISPYVIKENKELPLILVNTYRSDDWFWDIYLYKLESE